MEALASRVAKLELRLLDSQARAWEPGGINVKGEHPAITRVRP